jgi:N-acetylneuraminic acid mutarotase
MGANAFGPAMKWIGSVSVCALLSFGAENHLHWSLVMPMPEPRSDYAAGVVGGKLVVAGGTFWTGSKGHWIRKHFTASVHAFDPRTQTWQKLPDLPVPLGCAGAAVAGGKLYIIGGFTGSKVNRKIFVLEKRQADYVWSDVGEVPFDRVYPRVVAVGAALYLLGGTRRFEPRDPTGTCCASGTATRDFMLLDTNHLANGWHNLPPYPGPLRFYFSAETDGRAVWMFSGIYQASPQDVIHTYDDVSRYDISSGKWDNTHKLPQVSKETNPPSPVFVGDGIVLVNDFQTVWKLDTQTQTYLTLTPLPRAAAVDKFIWLNDQIIGASGENFIDPPRRRSEWVFAGRFEVK